MGLYQYTAAKMTKMEQTSFEVEGIKERQDLQQLIKEDISIIDKNLLVIAEEFNNWQGSKLRIDLLAVDKEGSIVVIELKRTQDGGHMELQAIRYAGMISSMTWAQAVEALSKYDDSLNLEEASSTLVGHLNEGIGPDDFGGRVRIYLVSGDFSPELTSAVLWLRESDVDIRCFQLGLYKLDDLMLLQTQQLIPLPEAEEYLVRIGKKQKEEREIRQSERDRSTVSIFVDGREVASHIKKSDVGLSTVKALVDHPIFSKSDFEFLRNDRSCGFQLLKKEDEIEENERKYGRYGVSDEKRVTFDSEDYYVARNWGVQNVGKFEEKVKVTFDERFGGIKFVTHET